MEEAFLIDATYLMRLNLNILKVDRFEDVSILPFSFLSKPLIWEIIVPGEKTDK